MKKTFVLALAVVLVFAFATTAFATTAKTANSYTDYYSWGTAVTGGALGSTVGAINTSLGQPGVHANYTATTIKCGLCHSVHRAKGDGVRLLNSSLTTCAACHVAGSTSVTDVVVNWETGGPHSSGNGAACLTRSCHLNNPHGAGGSKYAIVAAKVLSPNTDANLDIAVADATSGITETELNMDSGYAWNEELRSAVRTGYNCNQASCHVNTLLAVVNAGYKEKRSAGYYLGADYDGGAGIPEMPANPTYLPGYGDKVYKTGHLSQVAMDSDSSFKSVATCTSCHDQTDPGTTRTGYTFPHSQTARNTADSNTGSTRAFIWMTYAENAEGDNFGIVGNNYTRGADGTCLKCHRSGSSGIGLTK